MYRGGGGSEKKKFLKIGKKSSSRRFLAHPAGGQETIFLFEDGLSNEPIKGDRYYRVRVRHLN